MDTTSHITMQSHNIKADQSLPSPTVTQNAPSCAASPDNACSLNSRGDDASSGCVPVINQYACLDPLASAGPLARFTLVLDMDEDALRAMATVPCGVFAWTARDVGVMKNMRHSGLVALHEAIVDDTTGVTHLVLDTMEDAVPLTNAAPMPPAAALREARRLRDAMRVLHKGGVSHGAVTPENVVVLPDGRCAFIQPCAVSHPHAADAAHAEALERVLCALLQSTTAVS